MATLTYTYVELTAVLGPLAARREPHAHDLCSGHADALSVPRGWEVIRHAIDREPARTSDDLLALADAVREVGFSYDQPPPARSDPPRQRPGVVELARKRHLTVLADPDA